MNVPGTGSDRSTLLTIVCRLITCNTKLQTLRKRDVAGSIEAAARYMPRCHNARVLWSRFSVAQSHLITSAPARLPYSLRLADTYDTLTDFHGGTGWINSASGRSRASNQAAPIAADIRDFITYFSFLLLFPFAPIASNLSDRSDLPFSRDYNHAGVIVCREVTPRRGHRSRSPIGVNLAVDQTPNIVAQSAESTT